MSPQLGEPGARLTFVAAVIE
eukprot:COSAG01_NODE_50829_length_360_cov_0.590038_2_plen_20_part_01